MEKSRIRKLIKRFKEGKQLAYIDGRYGIETSIHNEFDWRFYVGNTPYVQCVLGKITACSPVAEKYEIFLREVWEDLKNNEMEEMSK